MTDGRAQRILKELQETFKMPAWATAHRDPFKTLIMTIISQHTADRNTRRAFESLSSKFKIRPEVLANARTHQIEQCLKAAGLYRNKAKVIREVSKALRRKPDGCLKSILSLPAEEARKELMQFRGIGPKTADVVLLFGAAIPTIPVDTHVNRVARRLGLAPEKGDYEAVRQSLQLLYNPKDYLAVHILLISHGRRYCRARTPLCRRCPVSSFCPSRHLGDEGD